MGEFFSNLDDSHAWVAQQTAANIWWMHNELLASGERNSPQALEEAIQVYADNWKSNPTFMNTITSYTGLGRREDAPPSPIEVEIGKTKPQYQVAIFDALIPRMIVGKVGAANLTSEQKAALYDYQEQAKANQDSGQRTNTGFEPAIIPPDIDKATPGVSAYLSKFNLSAVKPNSYYAPYKGELISIDVKKAEALLKQKKTVFMTSPDNQIFPMSPVSLSEPTPTTPATSTTPQEAIEEPLIPQQSPTPQPPSPTLGGGFYGSDREE
jgi:hypothetical protein